MVGMAATRDWIDSLKIYADRRVIAILFLGFSSGLPYMLVGYTLALWLRDEGVSRSTIGLFGFVFVPYTLKFIWAPLIDRMPLPPFTSILGQRRGWILFTQICLMGAIWGLSQTSPGDDLYWVAFMAVVVAFFAASQDVVIDAYRIDSVPVSLLGAGAAISVTGYRIAMWFASAGVLFPAAWYGWSIAYSAMALLMLVGIGTTLVIPEPDQARYKREAIENQSSVSGLRKLSDLDHRTYLGLGGSLLVIVLILLLLEPASLAWGVYGPFNDALTSWYGSVILAGNVVLVAFAIAVAIMLARRDGNATWYAKTFAMLGIGWLLIELLAYTVAEQSGYVGKAYAWVLLIGVWWLSDLIVSLFGFSIAYETVVALPWIFYTGLWMKLFGLVYLYGYCYFSKRSIANFGLLRVDEETKAHLWIRQAVVDPYADFFIRNGVYAAFVILALISVFKASDALLTFMAGPFYIDVGFSLEHIAWVSKTFGLWMTVMGSFAGGLLVFRLGMFRSMIIAAIVMGGSNLMFALVASVGHEALAITEVAFAEGRDLTEAEAAVRAEIGTAILPYFYLLIIVENFSGGIGTAIFVAFLSALCNVNYSATQYALLTSFMQMFAKFVIVPSSGFYADATGWEWFFITSTLFTVPAIIIIGILYLMGMDVDRRDTVETEPRLAK